MRSPAASLLAGTLCLQALPALGHGAFMDVDGVRAVSIHARYDTGAPMADAQVLVYAPDDPATPWRRGVTDSAGRFVFVPDDRPGRWAIQVRQAGHGAMSYFVPDGDAAVAEVPPEPAEANLLQRLLMVASVAWGCVGTALYFRRPRGRKAA